MRGKRVFICGTPGEKCSGSLAKLSNALKGKGFRCHGSPEQCYACYKAYLVKDGYVEVLPHAFQKGDGPILCLVRPSRFGEPMRPGKEGTRNMPTRRHGGMVSLV